MRADLLALSDDSLAALANRGIVRRAAREGADGKGPIIEVEASDAVIGRFPDGVTTTLPAGATLEAGVCTCTATGVCRHKVAVVLAYRERQGPSVGPPAEAWSPATFTDDDLEAALGARVMAAARQAYRNGYRAKVRRPAATDSIPTVELGSCTVRFLVPREIGYAQSDAIRGSRDDAVALAVWAFRAADEIDAAAAELELEVGGKSPGDRSQVGERSGVEPALALAEDLLFDGAVHIGASIEGALTRVRRSLELSNLRWPIDAVDGIGDQLDAYRRRGARYSPDRFAALLAELAARHRCVSGRGVSLRSQVLGTEEAAETPLRRLRLTGIGCRVTGDADSRAVSVYLVHGEAAAVLVLEKTWNLAEGEAPTGHELGDRRVSGSTIASLAGGNVVTESAMRSARRAVRIGSNRVAKTTIVRSAGAWADLPEGILVRDLDVLSAKLAGMPPRLVRPRVEADLVHVVEVGEVLGLSYESGAQRLTARIRATGGGEATVISTHSGMTPGALDALATALGGDKGRPRFLSGIAYRFRGDLVIDPLAVVAGETVVIPDLAEGGGDGALISDSTATEDALTSALDEAIQLSAEVAHRGTRHLPATFSNRIDRAVSSLRTVGLRRAADSLAGLSSGLQAGASESLASTWMDTHIRLLITAECL
jgi:hypothetical protein